jgi:hypothetical protein
MLRLAQSDEFLEKFKIQNPRLGSITTIKSGTIAIYDEDEISFKRGNNKARCVKFVSEYKNYLMKNLWVNGRQKIFFPQGEKNLWAYHYAKAVLQADSAKQNQNIDLRLSIDYQLTDELYSLIKRRTAKFSKYSPDSIEKARASGRVGVVVVDSEGRIRSISDFNIGNRKKNINPNDWSSVEEVYKYLYLNQSVTSERELLGNVNFLKMRNGPGSSIKPIIYAAVTSQASHFPWQSLSQVTVDPRKLKTKESTDPDKPGYYLERYAGLDLIDTSKIQKKSTNKGWFLSEGEFRGYNQFEYLTKSKNIYHSLIIYLGSYTSDELNSVTNNVSNIFQTPSLSDFPVLSIAGRGGGKYAFDPSKAPGSDSFGRFRNEYSALALGLKNNFNLSTSARQNSLVNIDDRKIPFSVYSNRSYYVYPEESSFLQIDRASDNENYTRAITQSTLGGSPIRVSSFKMAEMYAHLAGLNRNMTLTLSDDTLHFSKVPFKGEKGGNWDHPNKYWDFTQQHIWQPLDAVISSPDGTAHKLKGKMDKGYFYYAKTGTINSPDRFAQTTTIEEDEEKAKTSIKQHRFKSSNDKMLTIIISQNDLTKLSYDKVNSNRFYVIYITQFNYGDNDWEMIAEIINKTEKSEIFKQYMDNHEVQK